MEIPVLHMVRTVGTRDVNGSRERKDRSKRGRRCKGKSVHQSEDVKGSEIKVAKSGYMLSRKAAIVPYVPVP